MGIKTELKMAKNVIKVKKRNKKKPERGKVLKNVDRMKKVTRGKRIKR